MCIHEITTSEVMTVTSTLNNSAAGYDGIFPDKLKIAKIIPIYKSDNEQFINN